MGTVRPFRVILLAILLAVTAFLAHIRVASVSLPTPKIPLQQAFDRVEGWSGGGNLMLDDQVVDWLKLDDHLFRRFQEGTQTVTLYIGYYRTAKKVGAAHDPLVCFQGQGWTIVERSQGSYPLTRSSGLMLSYSSMIAERQGERELIVYWFQTNGRTSANTFSQKVDMVRDRLFGHGEDNAFVRITSPIGEGGAVAALKKIFNFIDAFYPSFNKYMVKN
ncbi:MAG: EpsI family protein [Desulfuromonadales bacterium]|nr:EpsI family protein [Desulfuromonadales bacterium]